jgi:predicted MFS family arabinose efflux permease
MRKNRMMEHSPQQTPIRDVRLLVPLILATIASQSSMASVTPLFVQIAGEFDVSVGTAGQLRAVSAAFAVGTALLVGGWIHRHGPRPVLVAGGALASLGALGSAAAPSFAILAACQALVGIGIACLLSSGFAGAGHYFEPRARDWAVGWIVGLQSLAWVVGIPLVGLLADQFSWREGFLVPAAFAAVAAGVALFLAPRTGGDPDETDERTGLLAALGDRGARRWTLGELIAFSVWTGEITYIAAFYIEIYDLGEAIVGVLLPTGSIAFMVGSAIAERVASRISRATMLAGSAVSMGLVAMVIFNFHPAVVFTLVVGLLMGVFAGLRATGSSTLALDQLPDRPGAMMAARTAAVQIGYLVGAALGGVAVDVAGYGALGFVMIVGMSISAWVMSRVPARGEGMVKAQAEA